MDEKLIDKKDLKKTDEVVKSEADKKLEDKKNNTEKQVSVGGDEIGRVIDKFIHRVLDIELCYEQFVSTAQNNYDNESERLVSEIVNSQNIINEDAEADDKVIGMRLMRQALRDVERHVNSSPVKTLESSLFVNLFAAFDKYIGDLIVVLYRKKPDLYNNIDRNVSLSDVMQYSSIDELRDVVLDKEIETLRRKSHIEQFKDLETRFSINLRKFSNWSAFVEASQRRNLFTHCDGVVSEQYLNICKSVGYRHKDDPKFGDRFIIGEEYFFEACYIITEVAVMLGQTLWRKLVSKDIDKADDHLHNLIFNYLHMEHWRNAISLSKFALGLPKVSSDQIDRINTVNYAIALKAIGKRSASKNVLDEKDWSASTYEFKLAYAVLTEDYNTAKSVMIRIGKKGELLNELSYHDWPLFRDFRDAEEFLAGYEEVYGYKYLEKLSSLAEVAAKELN